jgi:hypothetical protein
MFSGDRNVPQRLGCQEPEPGPPRAPKVVAPQGIIGWDRQLRVDTFENLPGDCIELFASGPRDLVGVPKVQGQFVTDHRSRQALFLELGLGSEVHQRLAQQREGSVGHQPRMTDRRQVRLIGTRSAADPDVVPSGGRLVRVDGEATTYQCAFCGNAVSDDPRWVRVDLSWEHSTASQQFGADFNCLKNALQPDFPLYDGVE